MKWKDNDEAYPDPDSENMWEPHSNVDCHELNSDFENRLKKKKEEKRIRAEENGGSKKKKKVAKEEDNKPRGFDRGLQPERITGATYRSG